MVDPIRTLFVLERPEAWVNIASVVAAMQSTGIFDVAVCSRLNLDQSRSPSQCFAGEEIRTVPWNDSHLIEKGQYQAIVFSHPYDRDRPQSLRFRNIAPKAEVTTYIPYGLSVGGGLKNLRLQYAQPTQMYATAVFARSEFERTMYAKHCPTGCSHVHVTGHPRFDVLRAALRDSSPRRPSVRKPVLLWNSHFSFGMDYAATASFSTFDLLGPCIFDFARQNVDRMTLIWRPHPALLSEIVRQELLDEIEIQELRREIAAVGIVMDESASHLPAFCLSDALLTDPGSFVLEYTATRRPILLLDDPLGEPLNEEAAAFTASMSSASTPHQLEVLLDRLLDGAIQPLDKHVLDSHLPHLDGRAGMRIARMIGTLCGRKVLTESQWSFSTLDAIAPPASNLISRAGPCDLQKSAAPVLDRLCRRLAELRTRKTLFHQRYGNWARKAYAVRTLLSERAKNWLN